MNQDKTDRMERGCVSETETETEKQDLQRLQQLLLSWKLQNVENKTEQFRQYRNILLQWNKKVNLTSITNPEEFEVKHYLDSLSCAESQEFQSASSIIDVGTGGGFPGVPLAIAFPEKHFFLLDGMQKRLRIVAEAAEQIHLQNITLLHGRAEEYGRKESYRERFDFCTSRAVANLATLTEYCLPFVKVGGTFLSYKGAGAIDEIHEAEPAIRKLGGSLSRIEESMMENQLHHHLIYIKKIKKTKSAYPRGGGKPKKNPIR